MVEPSTDQSDQCCCTVAALCFHVKHTQLQPSVEKWGAKSTPFSPPLYLSCSLCPYFSSKYISIRIHYWRRGTVFTEVSDTQRRWRLRFHQWEASSLSVGPYKNRRRDRIQRNLLGVEKSLQVVDGNSEFNLPEHPGGHGGEGEVVHCWLWSKFKNVKHFDSVRKWKRWGRLEREEIAEVHPQGE